MHSSEQRPRAAITPHPELGRAVLVLLPLVSLVAGGVVVATKFAPADVLHAVRHANLGLIALAFLLGTSVEALKAERARLMLSHCRRISWAETFGIQVVSHGIGHVIPIGPTTMALRCLLTRRVRGIPIFYSAGVFLAAKVLDNAALLPLLLYLLMFVGLHVWERFILTGMLVQIIVFLIVPLAGSVLISALLRLATRRRIPRLVHRALEAAQCTAQGIASTVGRGWRASTLPVLLTVAATGVAMLRLEVLLQAFGLQVSISQLCLLMLFTSLIGDLPIPIPGAGTWATAKAMAAAGVSGPGAGGYVFVLRALDSFETPILGLLILLWWTVPGSPSSIHIKDLRELWKVAARPAAPQAQRQSIPG